VDRASGAVKITRVVAAFDCGAVVNPDGLESQISGGIIQGIGGALFEAIDFEHGIVKNAKLAQYRVPRFSDVPSIDVILVNRKDQPSMGAGETPIIAIAPAVGAAIYDATGVRVRSLPMARIGLGAAT
jgi:nicotinate dehydrogenase subunit B